MEEGGKDSREEAALRNNPVCCHGAGSVRTAQSRCCSVS